MLLLFICLFLFSAEAGNKKHPQKEREFFCGIACDDFIVRNGSSDFGAINLRVDSIDTFTQNSDLVISADGDVVVDKALEITSSTASSSTTTGALVVTGGAGIGGNIYNGGNVNTAGNVLVSSSGKVEIGNHVDTNVVLDINGLLFTTSSSILNWYESTSVSFTWSGPWPPANDFTTTVYVTRIGSLVTFNGMQVLQQSVGCSAATTPILTSTALPTKFRTTLPCLSEVRITISNAAVSEPGLILMQADGTLRITNRMGPSINWGGTCGTGGFTLQCIIV